MSGVTLKEVAPAIIPTPSSGKDTIFIDSTNNNIPSYKDSAGVVHTLLGHDGAPGIAGADGDQGDDGALGPPGPAGPTGSTGSTGAQGPIGPVLIVDDGLDGADGWQGPQGTAGITGSAGLQGLPGAPGLDGYDPEEPMMVPRPTGPGGAVGSTVVSGTATLDFGAFPGASDASVAVIGQGTIVAGSIVQAWIRPIATADHSIGEHIVESIAVVAADIVAGVGFTIYGWNTNPLATALSTPTGNANKGPTTPASTAYGSSEPTIGGEGTRIWGTWTIAWRWT